MKKRTIKLSLRFLDGFGEEGSAEMDVVCSDMCRPYLKAIAKNAVNALNILERFHVMAHMDKAIDKVRAEAVTALAAKGMDLCSRRRVGYYSSDQEISQSNKTLDCLTSLTTA
jgi:transposase